MHRHLYAEEEKVNTKPHFAFLAGREKIGTDSDVSPQKSDQKQSLKNTGVNIGIKRGHCEATTRERQS